MNSADPIKCVYKLIYMGDMLCVKGKYCVGSYDENLIILKCGKDSLCITGCDIMIDSMGADEIYIHGNFSSIAFA